MTSPAVEIRATREATYRRNAGLFLVDGILFTVAMGLIGATTVIPDFVRRLTDSEVLIGLSGSVFEIGWSLPQLLVARQLIGRERRKWWFVGPNIGVRLVILLFGLLVVVLGAGRPGTILVAFFVCYGIAAVGDGFVGVPWLDLTGSSLDNRWRARVFGGATAGGGVALLAVSPLIGWALGDSGPSFPDDYALLFVASGVLFALSMIPGIFLDEIPGAAGAAEVPPLRRYLPELVELLRFDAPFRTILVIRQLTTLFLMASPFYVGFATVRLGVAPEVVVPALVAAQTVGTIGGALLYAVVGARNNVRYLYLALVGAALLPVSALAAIPIGPFALYVGFLLSGLASGNLLHSYQYFLVTHAPPAERPLYIGVFNTCAAVLAILAPLGAGLLVEWSGFITLFVVSTGAAALALGLAVRSLREPVPEAS